MEPARASFRKVVLWVRPQQTRPGESSSSTMFAVLQHHRVIVAWSSIELFLPILIVFCSATTQRIVQCQFTCTCTATGVPLTSLARQQHALTNKRMPHSTALHAATRYVERFDASTMAEMSRIVSLEGAALVERQTSALLGDIKKLTAQV
jgi:hypothetical protein